jgi:hypothetical protein
LLRELPGNITDRIQEHQMAKGQQRSNREAKKPKKNKGPITPITTKGPPVSLGQPKK